MEKGPWGSLDLAEPSVHLCAPKGEQFFHLFPNPTARNSMAKAAEWHGIAQRVHHTTPPLYGLEVMSVIP